MEKRFDFVILDLTLLQCELIALLSRKMYNFICCYSHLNFFCIGNIILTPFTDLNVAFFHLNKMLFLLFVLVTLKDENLP